jgi:uncharacterized protein YndB with AHSA1/START domain
VYWILFVMGALVAVAAALVMGGLATPRAHTVSRTVLLRAPLDLVWRTVRDVGAYREWRPELTESVASSGDDGPEWRESTRRHSIRFGVTTDEPPHRFGSRILDDDLPFTGEWQWTLEPVGDGAPHDSMLRDATRVTIMERGEIGNPIFRFIAAHMRGHTATVDAYLAALAKRVGSAGARIEDGPAHTARL